MFAENSRMDDRLSLRSRSIRRRSSDRDPNSIVETADATRETNLAITVTQLLRRNAPHRARSLEGQQHACPASRRHGESTPNFCRTGSVSSRGAGSRRPLLARLPQSLVHLRCPVRVLSSQNRQDIARLLLDFAHIAGAVVRFVPLVELGVTAGKNLQGSPPVRPNLQSPDCSLKRGIGSSGEETGQGEHIEPYEVLRIVGAEA